MSKPQMGKGGGKSTPSSRSKPSAPARRRQNEALRTGTAGETAASAATVASRGPWHRVEGIDALRGIALCLMIAYHFSFDLRYYGVTASDFEHDPFWLGLRSLIVALFMTLVGTSLVLADRSRASPSHYWRRIGVIAACALAASAASWVLFPRTYIYFGILHCIAVASLLAQPFVRRPGVALAIGVALIAAGMAWSHPAFDPRALSWIGFGTKKPATEDYVPLAPWAGFVLVGITAGHGLVASGFRLVAPLGRVPHWIRWLGRRSLTVYMVHQPLLLGALWLILLASKSLSV